MTPQMEHSGRYLMMAALVAGGMLFPGVAASDTAESGEYHDHDHAVEVPTRTSMPDDHASLPEGHPSLPEGHPPFSLNPHAPGATSAPAHALGTLMVKVVQGTVDGPALGGGNIAVSLVHENKIIRKLTATFDERGIAVIENVRIPVPVRPVVSVQHADVTYRAVGGPMSAGSPDQVVRVTVHEVTHEQPPWTISMRHVMLRRAPKGMFVEEMFAVNNPADRAWRAMPPPDQGETEKGSNQKAGPTVSFPVPPTASRVKFGAGFHRGRSRAEEGRAVSTMPLIPGVTQFRFAYVLPITDGRVNLPIDTSVAVKHLMVLVPDDGSDIKTEGLEYKQTVDSGKQKMRVYGAQNMSAGQTAQIMIEDLQPRPGREEARADVPTHTPMPARTIAGIGTGLMLMAVVGMLVMKPRKKVPPKEAGP